MVTPAASWAYVAAVSGLLVALPVLLLLALTYLDRRTRS